MIALSTELASDIQFRSIRLLIILFETLNLVVIVIRINARSILINKQLVRHTKYFYDLVFNRILID